MIAVVLVPHFPLSALLRSRPELASQPVCVLEVLDAADDSWPGPPLSAEIIIVSRAAWDLGVVPGMTLTQARALDPGLVALSRRSALEASALAALTDVARSFSPRVEVLAPSRASRSDTARGDTTWTRGVALDAEGLERLIGPPREVVHALRRRAKAVGLEVRVGLAETKTLARIAALAGHELLDGSGALARLPLEVLEPSPALAELLARFGLGTIGELLALPEKQVALRLGSEGVRLRRRARGEEENGGLRPELAQPIFSERMVLEWAMDNLEPLAFVLRGMLERLVARLGLFGFVAGTLRVELALAGGGRSERLVGAAAPTSDVRALLGLCRLALEQQPPEAEVEVLTLWAEPHAPRPKQLGLFEPVGPAPQKLSLAVARLAALCGADRVGSPHPLDSYASDAFRLDPFAIGGHATAASPAAASPAPACPEPLTHRELALHRFRPPKAITVLYREGRPSRLEGDGLAGQVLALHGPFRRSDGWWQTRDVHSRDVHERDVYDVELSDGAVYRLSFDRGARAWRVEGFYD